MSKEIFQLISYREEMLIFWGISRRIQMVKTNLMRYNLAFYKRKMRNHLSSTLKRQSEISEQLKNIIGDFSSFSDSLPTVAREKILHKAEEISLGLYRLLGSGEKVWTPLDWHQDIISGHRWPKGKFYKKYNQVDLSNNADVKLPRELSRCHHLLYLGQAYLITHDEKYTREFTSQIEYWINENPLMYSINWGCAMDVAIRAANWIYALGMFLESPLVNEVFIRKMIVSLYEHGFFVFNNLEKNYRNSNNHYLSNLSGLILLGLLFQKTRYGNIWLKYSIPEYYRELRSQILPSGASYEKSISYHRLVTELAAYPFFVLIRNGYNVPFDIRFRIHKMFDFVANYTKPDGLAPVVGDMDDGRFLPFSIYPNRDHRYLLFLSTVIFADSHYKPLVPIDAWDGFFLLGPDYREQFNQVDIKLEKAVSAPIPDAGFCILRHHDLYIFINNSGAASYPDQTNQWGSHAHADLLSFELAFGETSFLVDPGTYVYTSSPKDREMFRGTKMHNTLMIDQMSQHVFPGDNLFRCIEIARPLDFQYIPGNKTEVFIGTHDGYTRLKEPVIHKRIFTLDKESYTLNIHDILSGSGIHEFEWNFHFDTGVDFEISGNAAITCQKSGINLKMEFYATFPFVMEKHPDVVSKAYGEKTNTTTLTIKANTSAPCELKSHLSFL